jgi:hypothetical protein
LAENLRVVIEYLFIAWRNYSCQENIFPDLLAAFSCQVPQNRLLFAIPALQYKFIPEFVLEKRFFVVSLHSVSESESA